MKPVVLIDCDEVLCNFVGGVLSAYETLTGQALTVEKLQYPSMNWDLFNHPMIAPHKQELVKAVSQEGFCLGLKPCQNAIQGMQALRSVSSEVYVVTSPWFTSRHWVTERNQWLYTHFGITNKEIVHTSAKHLIRGDVFIDDRCSHVEKWVDHNDGLAVLWATPFNINDQGVWIRPDAPSHQDRAITNDWNALIGMVCDW